MSFAPNKTQVWRGCGSDSGHYLEGPWKGGLGHPGEKTDLVTFLLSGGEVQDCDIKDAEIWESGEKRNIY